MEGLERSIDAAYSIASQRLLDIFFDKVFIEPLVNGILVRREKGVNFGYLENKSVFELDFVVPDSFDRQAVGSRFVKDEDVFVEIFWYLVV